jgi:hypothetical protein
MNSLKKSKLNNSLKKSKLNPSLKKSSILNNTLKIAIITIFRDEKNNSRLNQKNIFLQQMELFSKYNNFDLYVVEQSQDNCKFNIGKLKNIGFEKAILSGNIYDYFIFTDIDIVPNNKLIPYYFRPVKGVNCLAIRGTRYGNINKCFMGSVIGIDKFNFEKINGYPNNFWGWGGEDDALLFRININKVPIFNPNEGEIKDLENLKKIKDKLENLKINNKKEHLKNEKLVFDMKHWNENGLNNLNYTIIKEDHFTLPTKYTNILVNLNYSEDILKHSKFYNFNTTTQNNNDELKKLIKKNKKCNYKVI